MLDGKSLMKMKPPRMSVQGPHDVDQTPVCWRPDAKSRNIPSAGRYSPQDDPKDQQRLPPFKLLLHGVTHTPIKPLCGQRAIPKCRQRSCRMQEKRDSRYQKFMRREGLGLFCFHTHTWGITTPIGDINDRGKIDE
jgi:hypothetical protein